MYKAVYRIKVFYISLLKQIYMREREKKTYTKQLVY